VSNSVPPEKDRSSPLRPQRPARPVDRKLPVSPASTPPPSHPSEPQSPQERLRRIREKMQVIAKEYAERQISRAQFNAIYAHYSEQRAIIERILARNPNNDGWKPASRSGKTEFLREHFEARPVNYVIYLHRQPTPLMGGGTRPDLHRIGGLLKALWGMEKVKVGVARVVLRPPQWMVMAAGVYSVTFVTFHLEPSGIQTNNIYDLHNDFERANRILLQRGQTNKSQLVFPQRSLLENKT
jgi:hypothetical protein